MMRTRSIILGGLLVSEAMLSAGNLLAGPDEVALSANYQNTFVNYLDVDRIDR